MSNQTTTLSRCFGSPRIPPYGGVEPDRPAPHAALEMAAAAKLNVRARLIVVPLPAK